MGVVLKDPWKAGLEKLNRFMLLRDPCSIGFQNFVRLDILKPIEAQLQLRELIIRKHIETKGDPRAIRIFVEKNSSLKIDFGFSFESPEQLEDMMNECLNVVTPRYNVAIGSLMSDTYCNWFGFMPLNIFEQAAIEDLGIEDLILYNNELIRFQLDVVTYVANHKLYKQYSIVKNDEYRFKYFKLLRHNEDLLCGAFWIYLDAVKLVTGMPGIPRDILEEQVGCHFLHHSDKFFEMMEFIKLKGELYE